MRTGKRCKEDLTTRRDIEIFRAFVEKPLNQVTLEDVLALLTYQWSSLPM